MKKEGIKVNGHKGTWYVIDEITVSGNKYYLLEHETYGEDAACICIREDGKLILEDIWNGIIEISEFLQDNPTLV
jgi:hypothetical protein